MQLSVGGILYTGIPFSGWYADTEIVRNLSDEERYNQLPIIATRLGLNINDNRSLWRDAALAVLNQVFCRASPTHLLAAMSTFTCTWFLMLPRHIQASALPLTPVQTIETNQTDAGMLPA